MDNCKADAFARWIMHFKEIEKNLERSQKNDIRRHFDAQKLIECDHKRSQNQAIKMLALSAGNKHILF